MFRCGIPAFIKARSHIIRLSTAGHPQSRVPYSDGWSARCLLPFWCYGVRSPPDVPVVVSPNQILTVYFWHLPPHPLIPRHTVWMSPTRIQDQLINFPCFSGSQSWLSCVPVAKPGQFKQTALSTIVHPGRRFAESFIRFA